MYPEWHAAATDQLDYAGFRSVRLWSAYDHTNTCRSNDRRSPSRAHTHRFAGRDADICAYTPVIATSTPTAEPTPQALPTSTSTPAPTQVPVATPQPSPTSGPTSSPTPQPTPTPALTPTPTPAMIEAEEIELLRQFAMDYWAALNDYDVGRVFYLFEDAYSIERDEQLRSDISRLKRFRVKLGTTHEGLPDLVGPDHGVLYVQVETPLGEA